MTPKNLETGRTRDNITQKVNVRKTFKTENDGVLNAGNSPCCRKPAYIYIHMYLDMSDIPTHTRIYICIYICKYEYVCVCACIPNYT